MYFVYLCIALILWGVRADAHREDGDTGAAKHGRLKLFSGLQFPKMNKNGSYADMIHNKIRPQYQVEEDLASKSGKKKKSSIRTIQKIIKKQKRKSRKLYLNQPSTDRVTIDLSKSILRNKNNDQSTPQPSLRNKKVKKFNFKAIRNPQPFSTLHSKKKVQRRAKRKIVNDNSYVFEDLDELKFVGNTNSSETISPHVKSYW